MGWCRRGIVGGVMILRRGRWWWILWRSGREILLVGFFFISHLFFFVVWFLGFDMRICNLLCYGKRYADDMDRRRSVLEIGSRNLGLMYRTYDLWIRASILTETTDRVSSCGEFLGFAFVFCLLFPEWICRKGARWQCLCFLNPMSDGKIMRYRKHSYNRVKNSQPVLVSG